MKTSIKYRYALNANGELIEIHDACRTGKYYCPQCKGMMVCKLGAKKAWHFAHNKTECDYNSYLHTIAEQRVLDWFNASNLIPLVLRTKRICIEKDNCRFFQEEFCTQDIDSEEFNLKDYYSLCEKEKSYAKNGHRFVADLLCSPNNAKNDPLFIEICVTHPCELDKLKSGIRIIEFVINSEDEIDSIIGKRIRESERVRLHDFQPKDKCSLPSIFESSIQKFLLFPSKKGYVETIHCSQLTSRRGIIEISIPYNDYDPAFMGDGGFFSIAFAVSTQFDKSIKHCCLCKYHVFDSWDGKGICKLSKKYGTNRYSFENDAQKCQYFRIDNESILSRIKIFDEYRNQNPVDIWIDKQ